MRRFSIGGKLEKVDLETKYLRSDLLMLDKESALNMIANNINYMPPFFLETIGLIFNDFIFLDNLLYLVSGKIVTIIDVMNKTTKRPRHLKYD